MPAQDEALPLGDGEPGETEGDGKGPEISAGSGGNGRGTASGASVVEKPLFLGVLSPDEIRRFYPPEAREEGIEGIVRLRLSIDPAGAVIEAVALNDPGHGFAEAARNRMLRERFRPASVDGVPVSTQIEFTVVFQEED